LKSGFHDALILFLCQTGHSLFCTIPFSERNIGLYDSIFIEFILVIRLNPVAIIYSDTLKLPLRHNLTLNDVVLFTDFKLTSPSPEVFSFAFVFLTWSYDECKK
jgi:hypothetical protein